MVYEQIAQSRGVVALCRLVGHASRGYRATRGAAKITAVPHNVRPPAKYCAPERSHARTAAGEIALVLSVGDAAMLATSRGGNKMRRGAVLRPCLYSLHPARRPLRT